MLKLIMSKLVNISEAARILGVTTTTLRNWDKKGLLKPDELTKGKARRYRVESLRNINRNIIFTKDDLKTYCLCSCFFTRPKTRFKSTSTTIGALLHKTWL